MVNNNLVGGAITILKNDGVRKNGKDDIPYMMENKIHVPKHQSVMDSTWHPNWYMIKQYTCQP